MKKLLLLILCLLAFPAVASHIVGGEFEMTHVSGNQYRIRMILYFDRRNGSSSAQDSYISIRIFRKRDNRIMYNNLPMKLSEITAVEYYQPKCSDGSIRTDKILYVIDDRDQLVELPASDYSDPQGYYISWERCCRNYTITNIVSEDPNRGGQYAGQTFYLEFPPVQKDGQPFINSSPRLFPPLSDYACPRRLYYVDFSGVDDDGDSLVYTLEKPLNTITGDALPPNGLPRPGPYPEIDWRAPFSDDNIMGGRPDLKISTDGLLTVTPQLQGLFVFAVKCTEYRDGVRIGEVRRDFQMLVQENCPVAQPPVIEAKPLSSSDADYVQNNLAVSFDNTVTDNNRCIEVRVTDPDSESLDDGQEEEVTIRVVPLGFKGDVSGILPDITKATLENGSAAVFQLCFPQCPYVNGPYQIAVISLDDACTLPLQDTIIITVNVEPPSNHPVVFQEHQVEATILEGSPTPLWNIVATDADLDHLELTEVSDGFDLEDYGFTLTQTKNENGRLEATLTWDTRCDVVDFSQRTHFDFTLLVDDQDLCDLLPGDVMDFKLDMDLYDFHSPVIEYAPDPSLQHVTLTRKIYESVTFDVKGSDVDNDNLVLTARGEGFTLTDYNMQFPGDEDHGNVASPFQWNIDCDQVDLDQKEEFDLQFIVVDNSNRCHYYLSDTLNATVQLEPPDNIPPVIAVEGSEEDLELAYTLGQPVKLTIVGTDADASPQDLLTLYFVPTDTSASLRGYSFQSVQGQGSVATTFSWTPDCRIFVNNDFENDYGLAFRVDDGRCFNSEDDIIKVSLNIKDVERNEEDFLPPNFISPNGDDRNDFFAMVKQEGDLLVSILPNDNCTGRFVNIRIYNRWGTEVYESDNRDFRWYAESEAAGVYYYLLKYSNKEYKGLITVSFFDSQRNR